MVLLSRVDSYRDEAAIRRFVELVLDMNSAISEFLREADPSRLVVVKPSWVQEAHEYEPDVWEPVITHPNVVLAVIECLAEKMAGQGTISVCDAPHTYASFEGILARGELKGRIETVARRWPALTIEVLDLRREVWIRKEGVIVARRPNHEDPRGYVRFNLGRDSLFYGHPGEGRYFGADYDTRIVNSHHCGETQEYLLAGTPTKCDLFVNLPKMKTHKKTGITCCLKNLVGINGDKDWLPHHTEGVPARGGDEFPSESLANYVERKIKRLGLRVALRVPGLGTWSYRKMRNMGIKMLGDSSKVIRNGNWSGNDTCWRMALDLNRCLLYGDGDGHLHSTSGGTRRYLAIVDGIVGGEGNGPLCPSSVESRVLVGGTNPACVDAVVAQLMGFDPEALPIVREAFARHPLPIADRHPEEITVEDGREGKAIPIGALRVAVPGGFQPHFGWQILKHAGRQ